MTYENRVATAVVFGLALGLLLVVLAAGATPTPLAPVALALLFGVLVPR